MLVFRGNGTCERVTTHTAAKKGETTRSESTLLHKAFCLDSAFLHRGKFIYRPLKSKDGPALKRSRLSDQQRSELHPRCKAPECEQMKL